jgi:hypothetical protein
MVETWMRDTSSEALEVFLDIHRKMGGGERLSRMFEMIEFQNAMLESSIRTEYPAADDREVFLRVASRRLGRDLMIKAYGWDPDLHP